MARIGEGQGFTSNEFKKAIYAIRGNNRQTKGMACAVAIEGQNEGSVLLVSHCRHFETDHGVSIAPLFTQKEKLRRLPTQTFKNHTAWALFCMSV